MIFEPFEAFIEPFFLNVVGSADDVAAQRLAFNTWLTNFYVSYLLGFLAVFVDAYSKYDRTEATDAALHGGYHHVQPSMMTLGWRYKQSLAIYMLARLALFTLVAFLLPVAMLPNGDWIDGVNDAIPTVGYLLTQLARLAEIPYWPLLWGLASAGVIENLPLVKHLEPRIRNWALRFALFPHGVQNTKSLILESERLRPQGVEPEDFVTNKYLSTVQPSDFEQKERSIEFAWAQFAYILFKLDDESNPSGLRSEFIRAYRSQFNQLDQVFSGLETRMRLYRRKAAGKLETDGELFAEVRDSLSTLEVDVRKALDAAQFLLACALPTSKFEAMGSMERLRQLGYNPPEPKIGPDWGAIGVTTIIVGVVAFFGALLSDILTQGLSAAVGPDILEFPVINDRTPPNVADDSAPQRALTILIFSTIVYAVLLSITFWAGRYIARIDGSNPHDVSLLERPYGQYFIAAAIAAACGVGAILGTFQAMYGGVETPIPVTSAQLSMWGGPLFVLCMIAQIAVYGPRFETPMAGLRTILGLNVVYVSSVVICSIVFFDAVGNAPHEVLGQTVYQSILSLVMGVSIVFVFTMLLHARRQARLRAIEARRRDLGAA